jgi:hypothetical protein
MIVYNDNKIMRFETKWYVLETKNKQIGAELLVIQQKRKQKMIAIQFKQYP